ncbi:BLUF domain-containing protein [Enterovibrio coralii]|uniref:BLUF domain-containing protein n=1 Tax=Enterovibrio coralii TaxID=294935 RepID=A0A135I3D4_9GAMM|nr:BLUF domain-containing protein [Enterovibrio coralii]KXF79953.1 hypothetical protein ATN88_11935 [Enterovibrio coralii]
MIAIVYTSQATTDFDKESLKSLLLQCRINNKKKNVTGLLLYKNREFIQVIEGEDEDVEETFKHIKTDPRHDGVEAILKERIDKRFFPFWAMGMCNPDKSEELKNRPLSDIKYNKMSVYQLLKDFKNDLL